MTKNIKRLIVLITMMSLSFSLYACNSTDKSHNESIGEYSPDNGIVERTYEKSESNNKHDIKFYVEPLKEYTHDLLAINYGDEIANNYKYKKYDYKVVGEREGFSSWTYSGPYSIMTFTYEGPDKNKMYVEFNNVEFIDYIYKKGEEYKFGEYPACTISFENQMSASSNDGEKKVIQKNGSIFNIEKQFEIDTNGFKANNESKKLVDTNSLNKGDKVIYGRFADNDLLWTVVSKNNEKLELISDYSFDFKLDYRSTNYYNAFYLRSLFTKDEYSNIEIQKDNKGTGYKFYILDEEKFNDLFKNNEDRKIYGCFGNTDIMGETCYYAGEKGLYYASVNAVDDEGRYYPAYDMSGLPNRICMQVAIDKIYSINKDEYKNIDFSYINGIRDNNFKSSYAGNYERVTANYIDNKIKPRHELYGFAHKLVRIGEEIKYVDANHNIHEIKELKDFHDDYKVGDIIYFGSTRLKYTVENKDNKYISGQAIDENKKMIFRIMDIKGGIALLHSLFSISDNGATVGEDGYIVSSLREYLNKEFYDNSFSDDEKKLIVSTDLSYYNSKGEEKKFQDKIFTLQNMSWQRYYYNMNTEDFVLSPKSLEQEYVYLQDLSANELVSEDGSIKYLTYNKTRPVWFISYHRSMTYGWSSISARDEKDTGFLPMLRIKLYDENISNVDDYYLPEFNYDNNIDRAVLNGKDLYFLDYDNNLYLLRDYNGDPKVKLSQITKIGSQIGMLYKKDDNVYFFSNLNWRDNWNEEEGILYISNKENDKIVLSDSVFARLFFDDDAVEFYVDGKLIGDGKVDGKKYILKDGILTDFNGRSKNIYDGTKVDDKDGIAEDEEIVKVYKPIVVDRDTKKVKIKSSSGKFNIIPYTKDGKLYIYYDGEVIELDELYDSGYYENPKFYYINKYDAYYVLYSRKKTENTTLRYLYRENGNIVLETLDEVAYEISKIDIYDGVFYYKRIPHNGWDPDLSTCYSVEKNENPKEIKYERLSEYYYYNPSNKSEFYINSSGDLIEIDKYGNRQIIEYYISDIKYIPTGVVYSKKVNDEYKVFYYDLKDKYEIGYGNALQPLKLMKTNNYYGNARDLRVCEAKDLFIFNEKITESINNNPALEREKFYKEVYDYLENMKRYFTIYNLYYVDENGAKMIDDEVIGSYTCGKEYLLYIKNNIFDFAKNINDIYQLVKSQSPESINNAEQFVNTYLEYVNKNTKVELYLHGNNKKYKIEFEAGKNINPQYITTSEVKNNKLYVSFNMDLHEIDINSDETLKAKAISERFAHMLHNYNNGKLLFSRERIEDYSAYDICTYENGKVDALIEKVKLHGDFDEYGKDLYKIFANNDLDKVYGIKYTKGGKSYLLTIPEGEILAENVGNPCSIISY